MAVEATAQVNAGNTFQDVPGNQLLTTMTNIVHASLHLSCTPPTPLRAFTFRLTDLPCRCIVRCSASACHCRARTTAKTAAMFGDTDYFKVRYWPRLLRR